MRCQFFFRRKRTDTNNPKKTDTNNPPRGLDLARVIEAVCSRYGVDRGQLAARGSRSPARAALAYLAKHHIEATRAELVPILGLSRPESIPNLLARFAALLCSRPNRTRGEISWHWNSPSA